MKMYAPNRWLVIDFGDFKKVFATWTGGYAGNDSWRVSSAIESITLEDGYYIIKNHSGSVYKCRKGSAGTSAYTSSILNKLLETAKENGSKINILEDLDDELDK